MEQIGSGISAIAAMFEAAKQENRAAFLPYFPIGYPSYEESLDLIASMSDAGADGFEIGVPFSDPLADGPIIQEATQVALNNGITVGRCVQAVRDLRKRGVTQPMLLMSYLNPLLAYGVEQFVHDAKIAGADGLIIPDLPPEEAQNFSTFCTRDGLALVFFLAPTSTDRRIALVARHATGFIYIVSVTGVTGARSELTSELPSLIRRVRAYSDMPLVVGFGISTPVQARSMDGLADGFIVGSALVRAAKEGIDAVRTLATDLAR